MGVPQRVKDYDRSMSSVRKRSDGRATMERVVEFARMELGQHGPVGFNLDRVIATSGVSRGSIYHHFGSRAGLITAVETADLILGYRESMDTTRRVVEGAGSGQELMGWVSAVLQIGSSPEARRARSRRIATLTAAEGIPALRELLSEYQREGMADYVDILTVACDRGLIAPRTSLPGVANLVQSLLVGRVLVDLLDDAEQDAAWVDTAYEVLVNAFNPQN